MDNYAETFKALSDETRLRIMRLLTITDRQVCVCEFVDALELPQYQVSKHLNILRTAKLVVADRKGTWVYYSPSKERHPFNVQLFQLLKEQISDHMFLLDAERLQRRMELRDGDTCVVGFANRQKPQCSGVADIKV